MIVDCLQKLNDSRSDYFVSTTALEYLDAELPSWREIIKDPKEWASFFSFDIHILQNSWLKEFADGVFDIIGNDEAEKFVWEKISNSWYRYAAIKRLISKDKDTYLPVYIEELSKKDTIFILGGWSALMTDELFDFDNAVACAIKMWENNGNGLALEYLAKVAPNQFNSYPVELKDYIIEHRDYYIKKNPTAVVWNCLRPEQKTVMIHNVIINENKWLNDLIVVNGVLNGNSVPLFFI